MIGKRSLSLIIACIVILSVGVCGFAVGSRYSTDTFGVTLPVGAELCEKESGYYRWVDDETQSIISVRVDKNTNNLKPSNVDLYKFENSVADDIDNLISGTEVDKYFVLQDVKTEIVEIGDYDFIKTVCTMNLTYMGRVIPANMYIFGAITENYIHYFYIMNLSDGAESFADEIVESIVIKDEKVWDNWFGNIVSYISGLRPRRQARIISGFISIVTVMVLSICFAIKKIFGKGKGGVVDDDSCDGMTKTEQRIYHEQQKLNHINDKISDACQYSNTDSHEE